MPAPKLNAAAGGISSPGNAAKTAPAAQAATAMTAAAISSAVTWPASFSMAMSARGSGAATARSRLPWRASPARVEDRARIDQSPARSVR